MGGLRRPSRYHSHVTARAVADSTDGGTPANRAAGLSRRPLGDERVRFILAGGFNAVFVVLEYVAHTPCLASLYGSYLIWTVLAFVLHRRVTCRNSGTGRVLVDFVSFQGVYVVSLALNLNMQHNSSMRTSSPGCSARRPSLGLVSPLNAARLELEPELTNGALRAPT